MQQQESKPRESGVRGNLYQLKILMMFLYRGITENCSFRLGTEIEEAQKFDDLVFEYTRNSETFYRFLQAKHRANERDKISAESLLTENDASFSLVKYLFSYRSIKHDKYFKKGSVENIILYTNIGFDIGDLKRNEIDIKEVLLPDPILDTKGSPISKHKEPTRYMFGPKTVNKLKPKIEGYYQRKLANHLVKHLLENKTIAKEGDLLGKYHGALSKEVIDVKEKRFKQNFIEGKNLSPNAEAFREDFETEIQKRSEYQLNLANLNDALKTNREIKQKNIGLSVRKDFEKCDTTDWPDFRGIEDDVKDFIDHLVFAVHQPNEDELEEELRKKIGSEIVYHKLFHRMLNLLKAKYQKDRFFSRDEGINLINDAKKEILSLQMPRFKDDLGKVPYKFQSIDGLQKFLSSGKNLWLLSTETPWLSSLVLQQSFEDKNCSLSYYNIKWIDLYENRGCFISNFEDLDHFLIIVTCIQMVGTEEMTRKILRVINDILYKKISGRKKVIVIASENHEFMKQMKINYPDTQNFHKEELKIEFSDLDVESQKKLLEEETIYFRGISNKRSITQLLSSEGQKLSHDQIALLNLDALSLEILLNDTNTEMWEESNQKSDFTSEIFKSNALIDFRDLIKAIESSENDIFAFYGDEEEIRILSLDIGVELKTIPEIKSTFCRHRFISLVGDKQFNYLYRLTINCGCDQANHTIHELKIEGGGKLMWLQTYSQNFYISRFLNPLFTVNDMRDMLVARDYPVFIVFSPMRKQRLMSLLDINTRTENSELNIELHKNFKNNCIVKPSEKRAESAFNSMQKIMNQDKVYVPDDTYVKISRLITKEGICWIRVLEVSGSAQFEWVQSVGDCSKLLEARSRENSFQSRNWTANCRKRFSRRRDCSTMTGSSEPDYRSYLSETSLKELKERLVVIADEPGMGKSSILTRFTNLIEKKGKQSTAIKIDLNKHQNSFTLNSVNTKETLMDLLLHFSQTSRYRPLMRRILAYKLEFRYEVILLCDGFDEMNAENRDAVLRWIQFVMRETEASVWITTRPNHKETLENAFPVLAYSFKSLTEDDIKGYLSKFWKTTLMFSGENPRRFDFREVAEKVANYFRPVFGNTYTYSFTAFPFMLRILAEKYLEVSKRILIDNITDEDLLEIEIKSVKAWDVYDAFIHQKYEIYFDNLKIKGRLDEDSELILRNSYSKAYGCLAAEKLYDQPDDVYSDSERENFLSFDTLSKIGLVQKLNDYDVSFIHPSFEEYFAFQFICNKLATSPFYEPFWDFLLNGILVHSFSSRLFDDTLQNSSGLASITNNQYVKDTVYNLLLDQVNNSTVRPVALWIVADDKLSTTVRFLITCAETVGQLEELLQYSTNRSMAITPENIDTFVEMCLQMGPSLVAKRLIRILSR